MKSVFLPDFLEGKVAFVTGGGSGICKGITAAFMAHGASAVIVGRKADRLGAAADELSSAHGKPCLAAAGDVRDPHSVEAALDACLERFGRVDIVVNGAAGNFLAPAAQLSYNGFKTVIEIDAIGTWNVSRAAFNKYLRDHGGNIINITATLHYGATALQLHASAAKAAVDAVTRTLGLEWGAMGIRVNGIAPGPIDETEGISRLVPPDVRKRYEESIAIKRFGTIEEVANVALFLVSPAASLLQGETIVADGGAWLGPVGGVFS